jgi:3-hydroxyisobutyrate dehydrogenase-like beta-hydroxyacid dehydrogenase
MVNEQAGPERTQQTAAALVIRVWRDTTGAAGIKARITRHPDLATDEETTAMVGSAEEVYREVRAWLEQFVERSNHAGSG